MKGLPNEQNLLFFSCRLLATLILRTMRIACTIIWRHLMETLRELAIWARCVDLNLPPQYSQQAVSSWLASTATPQCKEKASMPLITQVPLLIMILIDAHRHDQSHHLVYVVTIIVKNQLGYIVMVVPCAKCLETFDYYCDLPIFLCFFPVIITFFKCSSWLLSWYLCSFMTFCSIVMYIKC